MKESAIAEVVGPIVEGCGLEVDRIEVASAGRHSVLRVFLDGDGPDGRGPSLDEIADATRALSAALDATPATGNAPYTLEVSSRGATRPLTHPKHFRRNIGRLATLSLREGRVRGRIVAADDTGVTLDVDGAERAFAYPDLRKAVVVVELRKDVDDGGHDFDDKE